MRELGSGKMNNSETESTEIKVYLNKYKCHENLTLICFKEASEVMSDIGKIPGIEDEGDNLKNIDSNYTADEQNKDLSDSKSCNFSGEEKSNYSRIQTIFY